MLGQHRANRHRAKQSKCERRNLELSKVTLSIPIPGNGRSWELNEALMPVSLLQKVSSACLAEVFNFQVRVSISANFWITLAFLDRASSQPSV